MNILKHLICPDCQRKLDFGNEKLVCSDCGRIFQTKGILLNLLSKNLLPSDLAEERAWTTVRPQPHPLLELLHKKDLILHFFEQMLPKFEFRGAILEIGSGDCWFSSLIKLMFPETFVVASDVSHTALFKGIQVDEFLKSEIDWFVVCKTEQLPFEEGLFDFVVGSSVLHHTCPQKTISQIFRVLKENGVYVGTWELAIPRVLAVLWGSRFGLAGRAEEELGIKEGNYSLNQWKSYFEEAGFREINFRLDRNPKYKHYHWFIYFYYKVISRLPESFVRRYLACNISITARH